MLKNLRPEIKTAVAQEDELGEALVAEVIRIARIPSPTFHEGARSAYVKGALAEAGLTDVDSDELHNTWGVLRGHGNGPGIMIAAHMDTVFDLATPVDPRRDGDRLHGPGVRDNSASVAAMIQMARLLVKNGLVPPVDLFFVGTVGEEGRGDLRGMRAAVQRFQKQIGQVLVIDGPIGSLTHVAVGSRRILVEVASIGGHSWADYGQPSAIHVLGRIIHDISMVQLPVTPRTTVNVGIVQGGTSVNSIAERAQIQVDMRSVDRTAIVELETKVRAIIQTRASELDSTAVISIIGDREAGSIPADHPLVAKAGAVMTHLGVNWKLSASSTDANVPLGLDIPAVAVGACSGGGIHTVKEYLEIESLPTGLKLVLHLLGEMLPG